MQSVALSLRTAEFASSAVALMAAVESDLPDIALPLRLGVQLLCRSVVNSLIPPIIRRAKPARKANGHAAVVASKVVEPAVEEERSAWEPSSPYESNRCKALLLEILRRAAHDWVLYRSHSKLANREIAQDAFEWLFEENEEHVSWRHRADAVFIIDANEATGVRSITSFLSICEVLELDPEVVRTRVRKMDIQTIISAGRPAETRKLKSGEISSIEECGVMVGVDVNTMPSDYPYETHYESYGSVATPGMLGRHDSVEMF